MTAARRARNAVVGRTLRTVIAGRRRELHSRLSARYTPGLRGGQCRRFAALELQGNHSDTLTAAQTEAAMQNKALENPLGFGR